VGLKKVKKEKQVVSHVDCSTCPINIKQLRNPDMKPSGSDNPLIYNLGEAPGSDEDKDNEQFVGKAGKLLRTSLKKAVHNWFPDEDEGEFITEYMRWNNTIRCRPVDEFVNNREPDKIEIACCRQSVLDDIEKTKPLIITGYGLVPLKNLLGGKFISQWRGRVIPITIGTHKCTYLPIYHPSYVNRQRQMTYATGGIAAKKNIEVNEEIIFNHDVDRALALLKAMVDGYKPIEAVNSGYFDGILGTVDPDTIKFTLEQMHRYSALGFDIETFSEETEEAKMFRPWGKGARWLTASLSCGEFTLAFPVDHPAYPNMVKEIKLFFEKYTGRIICHNMKFEGIWLNHYLGADVVRRIQWDDVWGQAYTLDERTSDKEGMFSLGKLTQLHFGFNIKNFSKLDKKNLVNEDIEDVLRYNGGDAKWTYYLDDLNLPVIKEEKLTEIYEHTKNTSLTLMFTETAGVLVNQSVVETIDKDLTPKMETLKQAIHNEPTVEKFIKKEGDFKILSAPNLTNLFKNYFKIPLVKTTKKGGYSTDKEALDLFIAQGIPVAKDIKDYRELHTLHAAFVAGTKSNMYDDGLLHSHFNNMFTSTGRFSSESPNLQNYPKRRNKYGRNVVCAPEGYIMLASDYAQLEARVLAMASRDKVYCKALWNNLDVHGKWARRLIEKFDLQIDINDKIAFKKYRDVVKNMMVFPLFYGSSVKSCASDLGFKDYTSEFTELVEQEFWKDYPEIKSWQRKVSNDYRQYDYVETLSGRRRHAPLTYNMVINAPIQGTASDIVTDSGNRLSRMAYKLQEPCFQYRINIHDDLTFYLRETDASDLIPVIAKAMVKPHGDWTIVPLGVELSVGYLWGELDEYTTYFTTDFYDYLGDGKWVEKSA
jgi:uracil-DNA glycosylase family 4